MFLGEIAHRLDWGLGNPNKTATLIVLLGVAAWALASIRRIGFWTAWGLSLPAGYFLILTASRGGLAAAVAGAIVLILFAPRPWRRSHVWGVGLGVAFFCLAALVHGAAHRYSQQFLQDDASVGNRLLLWKQVPAMIASAPGGWGIGKSGEAFMQWYQPLERHEIYRTLVNSHFTWLVELGWSLRFAYILLWAAIFFVSFPARKKGVVLNVNFALWVALFVGAFFSSVAESPLLWILPVLGLAASLVIQIRLGTLPSLLAWSRWAITVLILGCGAYAALLPFRQHNPIRCDRGTVTVGSPNSPLYLIKPNPSILGAWYGHDLRQAVQQGLLPGVHVTWAAPSSAQTPQLVFTGDVPDSLAFTPAGLILLNPAKNASHLAPSALGQGIPIQVFCGEFSPLTDIPSWQNAAQGHPALQVHIVTGCGTFLPNWLTPMIQADAQ